MHKVNFYCAGVRIKNWMCSQVSGDHPQRNHVFSFQDATKWLLPSDMQCHPTVESLSFTGVEGAPEELTERRHEKLII